MSRERNGQKQAWLDLKDLIRMRAMKKIKRDGKMETDADVFSRIIEKLNKRLKKELNQDLLNIKYDRRKFF